MGFTDYHCTDLNVSLHRVHMHRGRGEIGEGSLSALSAGGYTDKIENHIFLIYMEIQSGAVAKSYMTNGPLIYGEIFPHFVIY